MKPQNLSKTIDFKYVSPRQQKVGTLIGVINRQNNTTNHPDTLAHALEKLKQQFIENNFPEELITEQIREVQNRKK